MEIKESIFFIRGQVLPVMFGDIIKRQNRDNENGACNIFLGQVRADEKNNQKVVAIEYEYYEEMARPVMLQIAEEAKEKFDINKLYILHSIGCVSAGEICLAVIVNSKHRKAAIKATEFIVEEIKAKTPVWGKEILEDKTFNWKQNTAL